MAPAGEGFNGKGRTDSGSVAVIGAGIAGLTAACRLKKLGMEVTVLEASDRVGGRMTTDRRDGFVIDRGAQFLSDGYTVIGSLINELGLDSGLCHTAGWTGIVKGGRVKRINAHYPWTLVTSGLLGWHDAVQIFDASIRLAGKTGTLPLGDYSCWHEFDDTETSGWTIEQFGNHALEYLFEPLLEGFYFQSPEQISRVLPAIVWSFGLRRRSALTLSEGIGSLPDALARTVKLCFREPAVSVEPSASGVTVRTPARTLHVDYAVLATPATAAAKLYKPASEVEKKLLGTGYSSTITISFALPAGAETSKAYKSMYGLLVPRNERKVIAAVAFESRKCTSYVPGGELLNVMLSGSAGERLVGSSEKQVLAEVLPELRRYFPRIEREIGFAHFSRWKEAEPRSPVGRSRDIHCYRSHWDVSKRVILAGDYMGIPCTEGAAESGAWAAASVGKGAGIST